MELDEKIESFMPLAKFVFKSVLVFTILFAPVKLEPRTLDIVLGWSLGEVVGQGRKAIKSSRAKNG